MRPAPVSPSHAAASPLRCAEDVVRLFEALAAAEPQRQRAPESRALHAVGNLLERAGRPQDSLQIIHIAGSKGKGSTALLCEAILQAAGLRTGTYTSPHLERWTERFRIDGREVGEADFVAAAEALRPSLFTALGAPEPPGFFDYATALALTLFRQTGVDVAVVETGLGGRLDATNIVTPRVSCITSIELEHTDRLGTTPAAIAREKAGIIKAGVPALAGRLCAEAMQALHARAATVGTSVQRLGHEFEVRAAPSGSHALALHLEIGRVAIDAALPVIGSHLADNAALAAACVSASGLLPSTTLCDAIRTGLARAALPGRNEVLCRSPWVIADGAHTEASATALMRTLDGIPARERRMVVSLSAGKDPGMLLPIFARGATQFVATRADPNRSLAPALIADWLRERFPRLPVHVVDAPDQAIRETRAGLHADALMCVTGSVYVAGAARRALSA